MKNILLILTITLFFLIIAFRCTRNDNYNAIRINKIENCYNEIYKKYINTKNCYEIKITSRCGGWSFNLLSEKANKTKNRDTLLIFRDLNALDLSNKKKKDTNIVIKIPISIKDSKKLRYLVVSNISLENIEKFNRCCEYFDSGGQDIQISIKYECAKLSFTSHSVSGLNYVFPDIYNFIDSLRKTYPKLDSALKDVKY